MLGRDWFMQLENWFEAHVMGAESLAIFGFAMILVLAALILFLMLSLAGSVVRTLRNVIGARTLKSNKSPGYRVMVAYPAGLRGGKTGKWLSAALETYLGVFNFGAPMHDCPDGNDQGRARPESHCAGPQALGGCRC